MPPRSAARLMRSASALLTASGFSIITWMRRVAATSTTMAWSFVFVNDATASGFTMSSITPRSPNVMASSSL